MSLGHYAGVAMTVSGGAPTVAASASIEVRREDTNALASIYSDVNGASPLANPFSADVNGRFDFYTIGRALGYKVTVTKDATSYALRHQPVGTAMYRDITEYGASFLAAEEENDARNLIGFPIESPTVVDAATIAVDLNNARFAFFQVQLTNILGATRAMGAWTNVRAGSWGFFDVIQPVGSPTIAELLTWHANFKHVLGVAPTLSVGPGKRDRFFFSTFDGTNIDIGQGKTMGG